MPSNCETNRFLKKKPTGAVISSILQPLQPGDEVVDDLFPRLGRQVVEVSEDAAHLGSLAVQPVWGAQRRFSLDAGEFILLKSLERSRTIFPGPGYPESFRTFCDLKNNNSGSHPGEWGASVVFKLTDK